VARVVRRDNKSWEETITGLHRFKVTPEFLAIRDLSLERGVAFTSKDLESANKVALLGRTVATYVFPGGNPVGKIIRIRNVPLTVIGLFTAKRQPPTGQDEDDVVLIPLSTAKKRVLGTSQAGAGTVGALMVQATVPPP
jgi:putative ABC transport system permease protein